MWAVIFLANLADLHKVSPFIHTLKKKECFGRVTITWHAYPIQLPEVNDQFSSLCSDWSFMDLLYINIYSKFSSKPFWHQNF